MTLSMFSAVTGQLGDTPCQTRRQGLEDERRPQATGPLAALALPAVAVSPMTVAALALPIWGCIPCDCGCPGSA